MRFHFQNYYYFSYAISNCKAAGKDTSNEVALYSGYCPNQASTIVSLSKNDAVSFKLNLFRIGTDKTLTFTCTVGVYTSSSLPDASNGCIGSYDGTRRRRSAETAEGEVQVTVNLADTAGSSAANTCANVIVPTFLMYYLF